MACKACKTMGCSLPRHLTHRSPGTRPSIHSTPATHTHHLTQPQPCPTPLVFSLSPTYPHIPNPSPHHFTQPCCPPLALPSPPSGIHITVNSPVQHHWTPPYSTLRLQFLLLSIYKLQRVYCYIIIIILRMRIFSLAVHFYSHLIIHLLHLSINCSSI